MPCMTLLYLENVNIVYAGGGAMCLFFEWVESAMDVLVGV